MGKKFFATMIVAVVVVFAGYNIYQSQNTVTLSDLALANVEALARDESGSDYYHKYYCNGSWDTNYYRCEVRSDGESCSGPNPPYPC